MIKHFNFTELSARERSREILDKGSFQELLDPFSHLKSPHLLAQDIVPQNDDGIVVAKGTIDGNPAVIISIEGNFQGGGIGEISGAKFAGALELALEDNKKDIPTQPIIVYDTGGVRLQEANYGLLAIAEISSAIAELRTYQPVIGIIPGKIGCFGGMSITAGLCSYLIITKEGRLTLNGPEVIEQEAGVLEFDSSDKGLIWDTIGGASRVSTGYADVLAEDDVNEITAAIKSCINKGIPVHRSTKIEQYQNLLSKINPLQELTALLLRTFDMDNTKSITKEITASEPILSRGRTWFNALTNGKDSISNLPSILCADSELSGETARIIAVVPDNQSKFPRAIKGEVGIEQGFELARCIREAIKQDEGGNPRSIIAVVDVPSQAYGYKEELLGLFLSCSSAVDAYAAARLHGHPVITFIAGNAISGAFLAHGLQGSYMLSLDDETINVHAMGKKSAARITKRSISEMEEAAKNVPAIAYDIKSFYKLGAVNKLLKLSNHDNPTAADIQVVKAEISCGIIVSKANNNSLTYRLQTQNAKEYRKLSIEVRERLTKQWD